jgi:glycogen synthase
MKILMLGWELPPYNSGGLGIACYQLCKALSKKDIDIEFILPYQADHNLDFMKITAASAQDVKTFLLSGNAYDSDHFSLFNEHSGHLDMRDQQLLYQESVVRLAETNEYDIVHAHDW